MRPFVLSPQSVIGVLCGGPSSEREVSLRSGNNCLAALHRLGYTHARLIDVGKDLAETLLTTPIDVAFLAMHGRYGEDGCIQGFLEILGIPYTGNRVEASALTMNKDLTKTVLKAANLPVIPWQMIQTKGALSDAEAITLAQQYEGPFPVMVKPVGEGSSVGMSKVNSASDLSKALLEASRYSTALMLEAFVSGKSLTVGVVDIEGKPTVMPILALITKTEWYDFEAKYTPGMTSFELPAKIGDTVAKAIQAATLQAHQAAGCHGVSRTDFVLAEDGAFYILEINTIPGMTDLSDLPAQAQAMGIEYDQLVELILKTAH